MLFYRALLSGHIIFNSTCFLFMGHLLSWLQLLSSHLSPSETSSLISRSDHWIAHLMAPVKCLKLTLNFWIPHLFYKFFSLLLTVLKDDTTKWQSPNLEMEIIQEFFFSPSLSSWNQTSLVYVSESSPKLFTFLPTPMLIVILDH